MLPDFLVVTLNSTVQQGTLTYCGFKILKPQVFWSPAQVDDKMRKEMLATWEERLKDLANEKPAAPLKPELCHKTCKSGASHECSEDRKKSGV